MSSILEAVRRDPDRASDGGFGSVPRGFDHGPDGGDPGPGRQAVQVLLVICVGIAAGAAAARFVAGRQLSWQEEREEVVVAAPEVGEAAREAGPPGGPDGAVEEPAIPVVERGGRDANEPEARRVEGSARDLGAQHAGARDAAAAPGKDSAPRPAVVQARPAASGEASVPAGGDPVPAPRAAALARAAAAAVAAPPVAHDGSAAAAVPPVAHDGSAAAAAPPVAHDGSAAVPAPSHPDVQAPPDARIAAAPAFAPPAGQFSRAAGAGGAAPPLPIAPVGGTPPLGGFGGERPPGALAAVPGGAVPPPRAGLPRGAGSLPPPARHPGAPSPFDAAEASAVSPPASVEDAVPEGPAGVDPGASEPQGNGAVLLVPPEGAPSVNLLFILWARARTERLVSMRINTGGVTVAHEGDVFEGLQVASIYADAVDFGWQGRTFRVHVDRF